MSGLAALYFFGSRHNQVPKPRARPRHRPSACRQTPKVFHTSRETRYADFAPAQTIVFAKSRRPPNWAPHLACWYRVCIPRDMERILAFWISYVLFAQKRWAQSSNKAAQWQYSRTISNLLGDARTKIRVYYSCSR